MSKLRFRVVETAFKKKPVAVAVPAERPSEYFAKYVFNRRRCSAICRARCNAKLTDVIDNGAPLDRSIADEVAAGMKKWAVEMGGDPLYALVSSADRRYCRKARCFCGTRRQRRRDGGIHRQTARAAGTGRIQFPERRYPQYVRGTWLLGMGPLLPGIHRRRHALHPDYFHRLYR